MLALILYTGPGCHLCDDAREIINQLNQPVDLETVNIRQSPELYHLYGARIPVVKRVDNQKELGWPFDIVALKQFLK